MFALASSPLAGLTASGFPTTKLVDIPSLSLENPTAAIKEVSTQRPKKTIACDILIAGGGVGGVAAALKILELRHSPLLRHSPSIKIVMTEESDWLGGQMTSQGVSALDENYLVETSGACRKYQELREAIRKYYRDNHKLSSSAESQKYLNPGSCWVSRLAFEPKVALSVIDEFIKPAVNDLALQILYRYKIFKVTGRRTSKQNAESGPRLIQDVYAVNLDNGGTIRIKPKICLDATELGDILALSNLDYSCGSESRSQTGEPHAAPIADPDNVQDFTYPFVVEFRKGEEHKIEKPEHYDEFKARQKFSFAGYRMFETVNEDATEDGRKLQPFWQYRRLIDASQFADLSYPHDLSLINWESNDLRGFNIIDQPPAVQVQRLALAKSVSLGFLYWLQNEAPTDDGGCGYPQLLLRKDMLGTADGFSKYPYIREARRAKACHTIVEQEIVSSTSSGARARVFQDSAGIGLYPVDIHGRQEVPGAWQSTKPFQIPLGALIPFEATNVLPACKNIGTTHITNGAYRLHPIEWAIGEAQGALAFFALKRKLLPITVFSDIGMVRRLQQLLVESGSPIFWYDDVPVDHPGFKAIQFLAASNIFTGTRKTLHFEPDRPITRAECAIALSNLLFQSPLTSNENQFAGKVADLVGFDAARSAIEFCLSKSVMIADSNNNFRPAEPLLSTELDRIGQCELLAYSRPRRGRNAAFPEHDFGPPFAVTRSQFAGWLYDIASSKERLKNY